MRASPIWCGGGQMMAAAVLVAVAMSPVLAATDIGKTTIVVRTVTGTFATQVRQLVVNDGVNQNEVIATAVDAASEILFVDGTKITVGPRAHVTLDKFVYDPNPSKGAFFLSATEGIFRFVTGNMAHQSYSIQTPNGTVGVRGTTVAILVIQGKTICHFEEGSGDAGGMVFLQGQYCTVENGRGRPSTPDEILSIDQQVGLMNTTILASIQPAAGGARGFAQGIDPTLGGTTPLPGTRSTIEPSVSVSPTRPR
jgi:FecR-like protein